MDKNYTEADWKLFRKKIPEWQEHYMGQLCKEYQELLSKDELASKKFWELTERIKEDRKKTGVIVEMRRSVLIDNVLNLLKEKAITMEDLNDFSDGFKETVQYFVNRWELE